MYQRSETFFTGHNGAKLYLQKWSVAKPVGTILITHGQGEHSECYHRLISGFQNQNWNFIAWDLRGHGRSDGLRGYVGEFREYISDFHLFIEQVLNLNEVKNRPVVLLSHSMGGLIQTCALIDENYQEKYPNIKAQVLSSPLFGVAVDVPAWKDAGAGFLSQWLPKLTLGNEIKNEDLTRDPDVIREYELDTFRHGRISSGAYIGMKREFQTVLERASEITLPTFMHISDTDAVVSTEAALKVFEEFKSDTKGLKIVEGGKHELYNDIVRNEVIGAVIDFVNQFKK